MAERGILAGKEEVTFKVVITLLAAVLLGRQSQAPIDLSLASRYFQEAKWASEDAGALWPMPLYGPMIFVDPDSHSGVANQPDKEGRLAKQGDVWVGTLPREIGAANTAFQWAGVNWSMVMWPVPPTSAERNMLLLHESFHRIQSDIGLPPAMTNNAYLDSKDGRIWLRLEWRALSRALISWGPERKEAITDALTFRAYRWKLFPTAPEQESRKEVHEGLAEYSGIRCMGLGSFGRRSYLSGRMKVSALKPSYTYSFAYETGPAYGLLLDMDDENWRKGVSTSSRLSDMLERAAKIELPADIPGAARRRAGIYGSKEVMREEEARYRSLQIKLTGFRKLLLEGPVLALPIPGMNYTFDPNEVVPMGDLGTVFPNSTISDDWGTIEIQKGCRVVQGASPTVYVAAPTAPDGLSGDGWKLSLKPGWKIVAGSRKGDFTVAKG